MFKARSADIAAGRKLIFGLQAIQQGIGLIWFSATEEERLAMPEDFDYTTVTELAGDDVSREQIERICNRYYWADEYCRDKDVLEMACGTGQGLGLLADGAKTLKAGDYSEAMVELARQHYVDRIDIQEVDAQNTPYPDGSFDVIILFEAVYYLPSADSFVRECARLLRTGGRVLLATANKDLFDFNPSPHSYTYYGVKELANLFEKHGFQTRFFGHIDTSRLSLTQKLLRPIKTMAVRLHLIPETMAGKKLLKRLVFGGLEKMPAEIAKDTAPFQKPESLPADQPDTRHKVIYCEAEKCTNEKAV